MDRERYQHVKRVFAEAVKIPDGARQAFLDQACGNDAGLRAEVESLLAHEIVNSSFLKGPSQQALDDAQCKDRLEDEEVLSNQIPGYRILGRVGEGGMGIVYRAEQEQPKRIVALKVIRPSLGTDRHRRRFGQEAAVLARLQHPGIAHIYEAGTAETPHGARPFFAMELIEGSPITQFARQSALPLHDKLELMAKVCDAAHHAHQKGVIHRDLKPANILVNANGRPKVLDFGVARAVDSDVHLTTLQTDVGELVGTIPYMSPEQVKGDPEELDMRSDVYALGVVAYELFTGSLPYELAKKSVPEAIRIIGDHDPLAASQWDRSLRGDIETILGKALEKDPSRRYQSAAELAADIRRFLRDEPITAHPPSAFYQFRKVVKRHRLPFALATVVFLLAIALAVSSWVQASNIRDQRDEAQTAQASAEAVSDFLRTILAAPNPAQSGHDVRVTDILTTAQERLNADLETEPEVRVTLRITLGETYFGLGLYDEADAAYMAALEDGRQLLGEEHRLTMDAMSSLGVIRSVRGRFDEALGLIEGAYEGHKRVHGEEDIQTLIAANNLAGVYRGLGRSNEALALYEDVYEARLRLLGEKHLDTLASMNNLGMMLMSKGKSEAARPLLQKTLDGCREQFGESHPKTLLVLNNYAKLLHGLGRSEEAEGKYRALLRLRTDTLPPGHPDVLLTKYNLALVLKDMGGLDEAAALMGNVVESYFGPTPPEPPSHWNTRGKGPFPDHVLRQLGEILVAQSDVTELTRLFDLAIRSVDETGVDGARRRKLNHVCGDLLARLPRYEQAEAYFLEAAKKGQDSDSANERALSREATESLIELYSAWGKTGEAAKWRARLNLTHNPPHVESP